MQVTKTQPLWQNRSYLTLISGQGISALGSFMSDFTFSLLVLALTGSPLQTGVMLVLRTLPYILFCLPAGALADRKDRKLIMIISDAGCALTLGSIPLAYFLGHLTLIHLYLVAFIQGSLFVFFQMAEGAALRNVVAREQLASASSWNEVIYSTCLMLGPLLGGMLYSFSPMFPFILDALSFVASVISLVCIRVPFQEQQATSVNTLWQEMKEGQIWLWKHPILRFLALLTTGLLAPCAGFTLIIIMLAQGMHADSTTTGFILSSGGLGSIIGALLVTPLLKWLGFSRLIILGALYWAVSWLFYCIAPDPLILSILNISGYAIVPIVTVPLYSYRLTVVPDNILGRVNSAYRLLMSGSRPIGIGATSLLLQWVGPILTIVLLAIPQLLVAFLAIFYRPLREARLDNKQ
uniref:MFS transporter n=1 Tax=Thermosporothrix sp. COM3 TaxID=2490863 RepID=A0A455SR94_9CHLR|nr:MFS transporter [Thermosporothrix sp. COM3]